MVRAIQVKPGTQCLEQDGRCDVPRACLRARSSLEAFGTGAHQNLLSLCGHFQLWPSTGSERVGLVASYSLGGEEAYRSESRDLGRLARAQLAVISSLRKKSPAHRGSAALLQPPA